MRLTIKDLIAGILVGLAVLVYYSHTDGIIVSFFSNTRVAFAFIGFLGIAICSIGGVAGGKLTSTPMIVILSALGVIALMLTAIGLITGKETFLAPLVILLVAMWVLTTIRHAAKL